MSTPTPAHSNYTLIRNTCERHEIRLEPGAPCLLCVFEAAGAPAPVRSIHQIMSGTPCR
jgi:hypothetical protein